MGGQELISNRKEVTEDEHGGDGLSTGDFFNRERMDKGYERSVEQQNVVEAHDAE